MQQQFFYAIAAIVLGVVAVSYAYDAVLARRERAAEAERAAADAEPFDAFAGGYPVPPMPGQQLPDWPTPAKLATATSSSTTTATASEAGDEPGDEQSQEDSRG